MSSELFSEIVTRFVGDLKHKQSPLLQIFGKQTKEITHADIQELIQVFQVLGKMTLDAVPKLIEKGERFIADPSLLHVFVESLYNYWRQFERFIVCDSTGDRLDQRPYRTFNSTIESLTHLVRQTYRDIEENITGQHPNIYRQISAGAELAVIALSKNLALPEGIYQKLRNIPIIRQILLYPPLLLNPPMNKRTGKFEQITQNPIEHIEVTTREWLCYPAKVGPFLILVYVHEKFYDLGLSLCNLFELADDEFLNRPIDAVYLFGVPGTELDTLAPMPTVFYEDPEHDLITAACPNRDEFGYFGYLKKMVLTLHNIKTMKLGRMPYHGALVRIVTKGDCPLTVLIIGDTGTGKSETLEAFRIIGEDQIEEMIIIADDMGSLDIDQEGNVIGYGTEVGAFVRLDDLQPGYAFGQLDRSIIMNPNQVNARIVLPVTTYEHVMKGYSVDMVLYANNYEEIDDEHPIIERLVTPETALHIFREGTAMSKGTTTSTGLVHTYFVNVFGAIQYKTLHDEIARRFFEAFFRNKVFVGQLRTRLGIVGSERQGPEEAAQALLSMISQKGE
ncbi:MAG: phosphoenolpyruvate carboxykinase [Deltaproteobacteria bacterium]|nr:phosphoenolpyruvate carboxykinase [Deltaproteobacteria bacterium]